jgi:transposase
MTVTRPGDGWVHGLLGRAARAVAAASKTIRALIILARVVCGDETPLRSGPGPRAKNKYQHVACTSLLTYYFLADRDPSSFRAFVYSDLHGTVIVHDRYQNYDKFDGVAHQLCTAHILRDLEDAIRACPDAIWPGQAADALRALIHQANLARDQGPGAVPVDRTAKDLRLFRHGVNARLSEIRRVRGANEKQPPGRLLPECLRHREADVLRFLSDTEIPPTNNQAERDARPAKTQQKISGQLRSQTTTRHRHAVRGYASTAAKHGHQVFTAIRDALAGNPWIPPIPGQHLNRAPNPPPHSNPRITQTRTGPGDVNAYVSACEALENGISVDHITKILKVSRSSVFEWQKIYRAHVADGLRTKKTRGPKSKLDDGQMSQLYRLVAGSDPRQLSFGLALRTRGMIQELILQRFGIRLSVVSVGNVLASSACHRSGPCTGLTSRTRKGSRNGKRRPSRRSRRERRRRELRSSSQMRPESGPATTPGPPGLRSGRPPSSPGREGPGQFPWYLRSARGESCISGSTKPGSGKKSSSSSARRWWRMRAARFS